MRNLSGGLEARVAAARQEQNAYRPNDRVEAALAEKTLTLIIGPCATGKSFSIDQLTASNPEFRKSRSFTTRGPRPDDTPETIRYISWSEADITAFCDQREAGELANYTFHPKSGEIYGTAPTDHPGTHNFMPTLATSVEPLLKLPFQRVSTIGFTTTPAQWDKWFETRRFTKQSDRLARIGEGIISLQWLLEHEDASIITNIPQVSAASHIEFLLTTGAIERDDQTAQALLTHLEGLKSTELSTPQPAYA